MDGKLNGYTCTEIVMNEDNVAYAHEVQQTHSESKGSTVTDTSKDLHSNSYAEKGMLSFQLKVTKEPSLCLLFCLWWFLVQETLA